MEWQSKSWHVLLYVEGELASHAGLLKHEVLVGQEPIVVGGIGGVATALAHHGKGYARAVMNYSLSFIADELKASFGLLLCLERLESMYQKMGWQRITDPVVFDQPSGKVKSPIPVMFKPCGDREWPPGPVDFCGLPW